jgi:hypothetical protein
MAKHLTITDEHIKLLNRMYTSWGDCEYGAPSIDCKRPYGNSDVPNDIYEILDWDKSETEEYEKDETEERVGYNDKRARAIHEEMEDVLQILVSNYPADILGDWIYGVDFNYYWERVASL